MAKPFGQINKYWYGAIIYRSHRHQMWRDKNSPQMWQLHHYLPVLPNLLRAFLTAVFLLGALAPCSADPAPVIHYAPAQDIPSAIQRIETAEEIVTYNGKNHDLKALGKFADTYEGSNECDVYMTFKLWELWKLGRTKILDGHAVSPPAP
jgi:hypothetical protein